MLIYRLLDARCIKHEKSGLIGLLLSVLLVMGLPDKAQAHFTHFEPRILHVSQHQGGVQVLLRMPLPLLLLGKEWRGMESGQAIRFTQREWHGGQWRYRIDVEEIEQRFAEFEQRVLDGYALKKDGQPVESLSVTHVHIFNSDQRKPFSSLASAQASFHGGKVAVDASAIDPFDCGIDIRLFVPDIQLTGSFSIDSKLGVHLNAIERLANIVQVYDQQGEPDTFSSIGVLHLDFERESHVVAAFVDQAKSGVVHILVGLDHVLFVLLLALASSRWWQTLKRATAFTLGHSITLSLGIFGYTPEGAWFIPLVETLIVLTILYGAVAVMTQRQDLFGLTPILFVGLIHGFGFSFVLSELVSETGVLDILGLIAFNLGIEAGQLAIYAAVAPLLWAHQNTAVLRRWNVPVILSVGTILLSVIWIYERGGQLLAELAYVY